MSDRRCASTTVQTLAALGVVTLLVPMTPTHASAEAEWLPQDLSSADRVGLVLDAGALRVDTKESLGTSASPRRVVEGTVTGLATFPEQPLEEGTDTVDTRIRAEGDQRDVLTEARGVRADGMWTEWHPAPEGGGRVTLPETVSRVQLRVEVDSADTALTELRLRPLEPVHAPDGDRTAEGEEDLEEGEEPEDEDQGGTVDERAKPFSAWLFATRIGLVGGRTANGHIIRPDDHFVALPSRRGLASRGGGEYTVRVCTTGEFGPKAPGGTDAHERRCSYLPVWDVGPWNITDDHWNETRESWWDLDRGRPQAQAAYAEGYNGGLDGFGRRVRNPAGIDLADGAFRHGLHMPDNGWVQVDYLWTGEYRDRAEITAATQNGPVIVRDGPGLEFDPVGLAAHKANVDVACQAVGDEATGPFGTGDAWLRIGEGNYVPAVFADGGAEAPACDVEL